MTERAGFVQSRLVTLDPRTPVIVGVGQYNHRADSLDDALEPAALMQRAVLDACSDAGLDGPPATDAVRVVSIIGWRYRNAPRFLAERLGIVGAALGETTNGGNSPQALVNRTALDIQAGDVDVAVLAGAEAFRTYMRARRTGVTLDWPKAPDDDRPTRLGTELDMNHPAERELGIVMPVQIYPMFETALRAAAGRTIDEHRAHLGRLWSDLSHVAAGNPHAWSRDAKTPEEITTVGPNNRMVGFPYPKLMNSNSDVDMGAAVIMCSVEAARRLGIAEDRWVFPHSGTDCHEHNFVSNRDTFSRTPAIELGGRRALELADTSIDDVEFVDLYSCFPAAVQLGAQSLGIDPHGAAVVPHRWSPVLRWTLEQLPDARDRDDRDRTPRAARRAGTRLGERWLRDETFVRGLLGLPGGCRLPPSVAAGRDRPPPQARARGRCRRCRSCRCRGLLGDVLAGRRAGDGVRCVPTGRRPPGLGSLHGPGRDRCDVRR